MSKASTRSQGQWVVIKSFTNQPAVTERNSANIYQIEYIVSDRAPSEAFTYQSYRAAEPLVDDLYSGFRVKIFSAVANDGVASVNINELDFFTSSVTAYPNPLVQDYKSAGVEDVTDVNVGFVNAYMRTQGASDISSPTLATLQARVSESDALVAKLEAWQGGDANSAWTRADLAAFGFDAWIAEDDINLNGLLSLLGDSDTGSTYAEVVSALSTAAAAFDAQFTRLETYLTAGGVDTTATEQDYVPDYDLTDAAEGRFGLRRRGRIIRWV
jgi:hypothetical protein